MDIIELLLKSLPIDEMKEKLVGWAKAEVEKTESPIDDHFVRILAKLLDVDYEDL